MVFPVMYGCDSWTIKKVERRRIDAFELWCWEKTREFLGLQGDPTSSFWRRSVLGVHWKHWCWSWNSDTLPTWCEELTHWKRPWCWERLRAGGEGDDKGRDGGIASPTRWTWVWVDSGSWWWTGRPGVLPSMGSQRVEYNWATELNWTFVGKVTSLLFNMLSMLVIAFLPRSKHLLILCLQSLSTVILEPKKIKSVTVSTVSPYICHDGTRCHDFSFLNVEF